jgi:hypothetical protein
LPEEWKESIFQVYLLLDVKFTLKQAIGGEKLHLYSLFNFVV